jgi:hypothetical protein
MEHNPSHSEFPSPHVLFLLFWPGVYIFFWPFIGTVLLARHYQKPLIPFILQALEKPQQACIKPQKSNPKRGNKKKKKRNGK